MTRIELERININRLFKESSLPVVTLDSMASCGKHMHIIGGYIEGKTIFHTGIIDYGPQCGEVWSRIEDMKYRMSAASNIRDLIDHIACHDGYREIVSSVQKGNTQLNRWSEWLGMEYIGSTEFHDHFKWRGI